MSSLIEKYAKYRRGNFKLLSKTFLIENFSR